MYYYWHYYCYYYYYYYFILLLYNCVSIYCYAMTSTSSVASVPKDEKWKGLVLESTISARVIKLTAILQQQDSTSDRRCSSTARSQLTDWLTHTTTHPPFIMERKVAREFRHKVGFETATVWFKLCANCFVCIISYYSSSYFALASQEWRGSTNPSFVRYKILLKLLKCIFAQFSTRKWILYP